MKQWFSRLAIVMMVGVVLPCVVWAQYAVSEMEVTPLGSGTHYRVGHTQAEIARLRISNRSATRKPLQLRALYFRQRGSVRLTDTLGSPSIWYNGVVVGAQSYVDRKALTFILEDTFIIPAGDSVILDIRSDIVSGKTDRTIALELRRPEDILAVEARTGFAARLSNEDDFPITFDTYSVGGGSLYITRSPYSVPRYSSARTWRSSTPRELPRPITSRAVTGSRFSSTPVSSGNIYSGESRTYTPGARDVVFFSSFITTARPASIEGVILEVDGNSSAADKDGNNRENELSDFNRTFTDFQLYIDGQYAGHANALERPSGADGMPGNYVLRFDGGFTVRGRAQIIVTGRTTYEAVSGDKLRLKLDGNGLQDPEYLDTGEGITPSGGQSGGRVEVE